MLAAASFGAECNSCHVHLSKRILNLHSIMYCIFLYSISNKNVSIICIIHPNPESWCLIILVSATIISMMYTNSVFVPCSVCHSTMIQIAHSYKLY